MANTRRYVPWIVLVLGGLVVVGSDLLEPSRPVHLALTVGGAVVMFLGIVWADLRSTHGCLVDERYVEIHHRSGYFGFVVLGALLITTSLVLLNTGLVVPADALLLGAALLGLVAYRGSVAWLKRTM